MKWLLIGLLGIAFLVLAIRWLGYRRWLVKTHALLERLDRACEKVATERFDPKDLEGLPEPVARHLRQVLPEWTPIIRALDLIHRGTFNMSQAGEQWRPFTSRQRVVTGRPGFVWDGRVSVVPGIDVLVHDAYVAGEGMLEPAIAGLFTLVKLRDRGELARGELMRFLAEAVWYPTALLPSQGIRWVPIDANIARAELDDGGLRVSMTCHFGMNGLIDSVRVEDRGRAVGDQVIPTPWEVRMSNYQRRDGLLIPVVGEVAWLTPDGRLPYWRGRITELRYHR